ncbi:hypothetical protein E1B28_002540 [Marasmius oreades]|uniref:Uncharacterized protein n=1 Tax=Marasmius oreades TaxID=181124 RepID=A0A9P7RN83_9AGAR|nr:uncharacterized protein E1B28_002540 [Marasmius oreades]KAG7086595.1 hypothetical protein E1B28_002540 [Marasmius oreades]
MQPTWESPDFYLASLSLHNHTHPQTHPQTQQLYSFWNSILLSPYLPHHPPSPQSDASSSPSTSTTSITPPLPPPRRPQQALHVICNAPIIAPKPLPYHSPTFLKFELLPDIEEDLSHPPYIQRPSKRKRENGDSSDEFVTRKRRTKDIAGPPRPPSVYQRDSTVMKHRQRKLASRGTTANPQLTSDSHSNRFPTHRARR